MKEEFKNISEYENHYMISNLGKVKSLKPRSEDILKPRYNNKGYDTVALSLNGKRKQFKVHRLIAETFIKNPLNKPHINHIDSNPSNNKMENLEWCTHTENMKHAWKHGRGTITEAQRRRNVTQTFNANVKYKKLQGQQFGSILIIGNITFNRGNLKANTKCLRCGTVKNKSIRAELNGVTRMCLSCKSKSLGRFRKYKNLHKDMV